MTLFSNPADVQAQHGEPLSAALRVLLAQHQIRLPECEGGLGISSMTNAVQAAFYAATVRFFDTPHARSLVLDASAPDPRHPPGLPRVLPALQTNISKWLRDTTEELQTIGAELYKADAEVPDPAPAMCLPEPSILLQPGALNALATTLATASNQHTLTIWITKNNPALRIFQAVLDASPGDKARVAHLQQVLLKGQDVRLPIDPDKVIKFSPMSFFMRGHHCSLSSFQCSVYLSLCLGLPLPDMGEYCYPVCRCNTPFSKDGAHALNCSKWASRGWSAGHDGLVHVLADELRRLGLSANADPGLLRSRFSHVNSQKRADCLVKGSGALRVTDNVANSKQSYETFLFDVCIPCPVKASSEWHPNTAYDANGSNLFLQDAESAKYSKHEAAYAIQSLGFLAFAVSSFGVLGPTLLRFLTLLADLKMQRYSEFRSALDLFSMTPRQHDAIRAQYLSGLFSSVGDAIAKATIMRLVGRGHAPSALSVRTFQHVNLQHLAPPFHYTYADAAAARPLHS